MFLILTFEIKNIILGIIITKNIKKKNKLFVLSSFIVGNSNTF